MKTWLVVAMMLGSTVDAMAVESYGDYRDYFDAKPAAVERTPRRASGTTHPLDTRRPGQEGRAEMYRYDDGGIGRTPDVRARSWDGLVRRRRALARDGGVAGRRHRARARSYRSVRHQ